MLVNVMYGIRVRRLVRIIAGLLFAFLTACASATPAPAPTASPVPTISSPATAAPTEAAPTLAPATATTAPTVAPTETNPAATVTVAATAAATATAASTATAATATATVAPSATAAPTAKPTAKPTSATASDFTPQQVSVWNTALTGSDTMTGACSNPVNPVYGLVQVTPQGNSLIWKNQEPSPYTMTRVRPSVWQYSGPTSIGDGTVTMVVQFTSATTLQLTRTFVATAAPNCTHVHHYTGNFQWNR